MKEYIKPEVKTTYIDMTQMLCASGGSSSGGSSSGGSSSGGGSGDSGSSSYIPSSSGGISILPSITGGSGNAGEEACSKGSGLWD